MAHSVVVTIRNRLYPAADQEPGCLRHCAHARFVWDLAVEQQSWWWPGRGSAPGSAVRQRQLAEARAAEPWLREGSSSVQLNIKGMIHKPAPKPDPEKAGNFLPNKAHAKAGLSRGILASCWGTLGQRIEQKAQAAGATAVFTDPRFTSQQCHVCGHTSAGNRDNQAVFRCKGCGHQDHADVNAARNILARGLALTANGIFPAHAPGHGMPRPCKPLARAGAAGTTRTAA